MEPKDLKKWNEAKEYMGQERITLGPHYSYVLKNLTRRLGFILSRYKFAAKMIGENKYVLEVGCSEGFGTMILAETARKVVAVDFDKNAIEEAQKSFASGKVEFREANFLKASIDTFDAVVALDVVEHIYPEDEAPFFESAAANLDTHGICIVGTPNKTAEQYGSPTSRISHINLYTWDRLKSVMERYFHNVFLFSVNDEVVHTGFYPMAHYLMAMGVGKR
ncbi:MAG: class I SAM-dependent methyltransferase [Candidatus Omnitrophica bacterium]|nr:class I SAM-dependent methyltransferase [Candidatus Omnitrophota bacterium]